ncbi:MAG: nucleotidyl transferase AbiEii/AbiGii toxin family protein [Deinococcus sp.]
MTRTTNPAGLLDRLKHLQRTRFPNIPPNTMLLLYAQQGLLGRLGASPYAEQFVLKGALSLFARYGNAARPTQDIDLAGRGLSNTPGQIRTVLEDLCTFSFGDGLIFDPASIQASPINEASDYPGVTAKLRATLGPSQVTLQLDFSFGNVITPAPVHLDFPPLLLDQAVRVASYPLETVITEKFAALVEIGEATTRMKDLYDLQIILSTESFEANTVHQALARSFAARGRPIDHVQAIFSDVFASEPVLAARWGQYLRRNGFSAPAFTEVMGLLRVFYAPLLLGGRTEGTWTQGTWR